MMQAVHFLLNGRKAGADGGIPVGRQAAQRQRRQRGVYSEDFGDGGPGVFEENARVIEAQE